MTLTNTRTVTTELMRGKAHELMLLGQVRQALHLSTKIFSRSREQLLNTYSTCSYILIQGIEVRLGETESETNHQVAIQKQVYSELQEQITLDISEAIEQYQAMIGMNKVIILITCHCLMSPIK